MPLCLIMTVGVGKVDPNTGEPDIVSGLRRSVSDHNPDRIHAIVTREAERTLEYLQHRIGSGLEIRKHYTRDEDSIMECYRAASEAIRAAIEEGFRPADIVVDITFGTKPMAAGLAVAAVDAGCRFTYVGGDRDEAGRVISGTEEVRTRRPVGPVNRRLCTLAAELFNKGLYDAAKDTLDAVTATHDEKLQQWVGAAAGLAAGYSKWLAFDHAGALEALRRVAGAARDALGVSVEQNIRFLAAVNESKPSPDQQPAVITLQAAQPILADLIANAHHQASLGHYDDALARLYRATELVGQALAGERLQISTARVPLNELPAQLREQLAPTADDKGFVRLGLDNTFKLLTLTDIIGPEVYEQNDALKDARAKRNSSVLAHGLEPVAKEQLDRYLELLEQLIRRTIGDAVYERWLPMATKVTLDPATIP